MNDIELLNILYLEFLNEVEYVREYIKLMKNENNHCLMINVKK